MGNGWHLRTSLVALDESGADCLESAPMVPQPESYYMPQLLEELIRGKATNGQLHNEGWMREEIRSARARVSLADAHYPHGSETATGCSQANT